MTITVVTSITDDGIYGAYLGASLSRQKMPFDLIKTDPELKLTESYLRGIPEDVDTDYILVTHQDIVFCEEGCWLDKAEKLCNALPDLGVAGIAGWHADSSAVQGFFVASYGNEDYANRPPVRYHGRKYVGEIRGVPFREPKEIQVLDDMCIIIPTKVWHKQKFDPAFEFHLNGQDYCLAVKHSLGLKTYVLPLKTYEVSTTSYVDGYFEKHGRMEPAEQLLKMKWRHLEQYAGAVDLRS